MISFIPTCWKSPAGMTTQPGDPTGYKRLDCPLFLGDADGFSILYYQDVDSLVYWANEAAYRWGLRGIAIWSLGQEDMRLWEVMPKQI